MSFSPSPDFVDPLDTRHMCLVCRNVARESMQTSCGHRICENCKPELFKGGSPVQCPAREADCDELTPDDITPDPSGRKEIRNLKVNCSFKLYGCHEQRRWNDLSKHLIECTYQPMQCPNQANGCQVTLPRKQMEVHMQGACEYRLKPCAFCRNPVPLKLEKEHLQNDCLENVLECPYNCGVKGIKRLELNAHREVCPNKPKECIYKEIGCNYVGTEPELEKHIRESNSLHLNHLTIYSRQMENSHLEVKQKFQEYADAQRKFEADFAKIRDLVSKLQTENREAKLKMVDVVQRVVHLERKVELCATRDRVDQLDQDIRSNTVGLTQVQSQLVAQNRIMEELKTTVEQRRPGGASEDSTELRRKVTAVETSITAINVQMGELDLRFQILETTSYDGILLWKIRDYQRRKAEAVAGRTLSLYSQPFFTHRYGYKMCARVYLNGDGMGKGTHLSLFFVVMKGEFDNLLPWPFKQKVTLQLLDQDSGQTNLTDSFMPDVNSSSFRKPTTDMNVASGCPLFVAHSVLENPKYVKDDALILKIIVDTNNLRHP